MGRPSRSVEEVVLHQMRAQEEPGKLHCVIDKLRNAYHRQDFGPTISSSCRGLAIALMSDVRGGHEVVAPTVRRW